MEVWATVRRMMSLAVVGLVAAGCSAPSVCRFDSGVVPFAVGGAEWTVEYGAGEGSTLRTTFGVGGDVVAESAFDPSEFPSFVGFTSGDSTLVVASTGEHSAVGWSTPDDPATVIMFEPVDVGCSRSVGVDLLPFASGEVVVSELVSGAWATVDSFTLAGDGILTVTAPE